jgi:hypothetical protein
VLFNAIPLGWPTVESSVYCLPADLLGEGAGQVAARISERAGAPGLTVAACYHASRDILPHNPVYRVASLAPGAFYQVDPAAYPGALRPAVSPSAAGRDILAEACQAAGRLGLPVSAWAVLLHRDDLDDRPPEVQQNCFGDRFPGRLCPASPAVRDYVLAMTRELCRYPIAALRAEALHYQGAAHGHHHERCLEDYGELARFLLGLCFCPSCAERGTRRGADVPSLAARCRAHLSRAFDGTVPPRPASATPLTDACGPDALTDACGPDIHAYLAARTATVTALAQAATGQARQAGVPLTFLDETIPMQAYATGHGFDPGHVAVRAELGVDPPALAQAGVHLEEPVYLADPAEASAAIAWYRRQIGPTAPLSVLLTCATPVPLAPSTPIAAPVSRPLPSPDEAARRTRQSLVPGNRRRPVKPSRAEVGAPLFPRSPNFAPNELAISHPARLHQNPRRRRPAQSDPYPAIATRAPLVPSQHSARPKLTTAMPHRRGYSNGNVTSRWPHRGPLAPGIAVPVPGLPSPDPRAFPRPGSAAPPRGRHRPLLRSAAPPASAEPPLLRMPSASLDISITLGKVSSDTKQEATPWLARPRGTCRRSSWPSRVRARKP